jgi:hypothetical protein
MAGATILVVLIGYHKCLTVQQKKKTSVRDRRLLIIDGRAPGQHSQESQSGSRLFQCAANPCYPSFIPTSPTTALPFIYLWALSLERLACAVETTYCIIQTDNNSSTAMPGFARPIRESRISSCAEYTGLRIRPSLTYVASASFAQTSGVVAAFS